MAVTAAALVAVIPGLSESDATDLASAAADLVTTYLRGGACPESVRDHAVVRVARFMHGTPGEAGGRVEVDGVPAVRPRRGRRDAPERRGPATGQVSGRARGNRAGRTMDDD